MTDTTLKTMLQELANEGQQADSGLEKVIDVFYPHYRARRAHVERTNTRFVHYTTSEVAMSIIQKKQVWMRNASVMNDYMEVEHGFQCLNAAYSDSEHGQRFRECMEGVFPGITTKLQESFKAWMPGFRRGTYLTCLSEHDETQDNLGRLSMWRAYGGNNGIALVLNNRVFLSETDALKVYTNPVAYHDHVSFEEEFRRLAGAVDEIRDDLRALGEETVFSIAFNMFRFAVLCTKHKGFAEEREWRVIYSPLYDSSERVIPKVELVKGVPQLVQKIPLEDIPEEGLTGLSIPDLLERIIIGPTQYPEATYQAFFSLLKDAGIENPATKIFYSDIPLRN